MLQKQKENQSPKPKCVCTDMEYDFCAMKKEA